MLQKFSFEWISKLMLFNTCKYIKVDIVAIVFLNTRFGQVYICNNTTWSGKNHMSITFRFIFQLSHILNLNRWCSGVTTQSGWWEAVGLMYWQFIGCFNKYTKDQTHTNL